MRAGQLPRRRSDLWRVVIIGLPIAAVLSLPALAQKDGRLRQEPERSGREAASATAAAEADDPPLTDGEVCPRTEGERLDDPIPEPLTTGDLQVGLRTVAGNMTAPNWAVQAPGCRNLFLFVTDQVGILWQVNLLTGNKQIFLDVRDRLVDLNDGYDERGLLGVAFHPDFVRNGLFYTYTSEPAEGQATFSTVTPQEAAILPDYHFSVVTEWRVDWPRLPWVMANPTSARVLMTIAQPQMNHNAGCLVFGPDRQLYIALGDGGGADDQGIGHVAGGNAQDPSNILGSILRIDPRGSNSSNGQYGIPADNPFVGVPDALDEIWAYGFRNPFRISFDSSSGLLLAGDAGQAEIEEIDVVVRGGNYGWRCKEGSFAFEPGDLLTEGFPTTGEVLRPDLIDPIAECDHDGERLVALGGFVYRGRQSELQGRYIFGDYVGELYYLNQPVQAGQPNEILKFQVAGTGLTGRNVLGFGQDLAGEVYVLANKTGTPTGQTGVLLKIVPPTAVE